MNVSLVELLQGERTPSPTLTKEEAGQAAVQAMEQSQKNTARRYLRLFQVVLWIGATLCLISLIPPLTFWGNLLWLDLFRSQGLGVIGSADGPTVILTAGGPLIPYEAQTVLIVLALLTCAVMGRPSTAFGEETEMKLCTLLMCLCPGAPDRVRRSFRLRQSRRV